jgi:TolB protein
VRRLTNNLKIADSTPTWSPTGTHLAFTSDRSGAPQIWVMDTEGLNVRRLTFSDSGADRATWSPAPFNEIAYSAMNGPGIDIRIYDVATGQTRQLTNGEGSNESPAFAPNGRHLAFSSTRAGKKQIYTIARDGKQLTKITSAGNNTTPNWSR